MKLGWRGSLATSSPDPCSCVVFRAVSLVAKSQGRLVGKGEDFSPQRNGKVKDRELVFRGPSPTRSGYKSGHRQSCQFLAHLSIPREHLLQLVIRIT